MKNPMPILLTFLATFLPGADAFAETFECRLGTGPAFAAVDEVASFQVETNRNYVFNVLPKSGRAFGVTIDLNSPFEPKHALVAKLLIHKPGVPAGGYDPRWGSLEMKSKSFTDEFEIQGREPADEDLEKEPRAKERQEHRLTYRGIFLGCKLKR